MRTLEAFSKTFEDVKFYLNLHKKPVWLVPLDNGYSISCIKPKPSELPRGTTANLYSPELEIIDNITSSFS